MRQDEAVHLGGNKLSLPHMGGIMSTQNMKG
jgi:hypothetical protein